MTKKKEPVAESPGYCTAETLANLFNISGQWVGQLTRDGVLVKRKTDAGTRYNIVEATRAYVTHLREKINDKNSKNNQDEKDKLNADARLKKAKAEKAEIELAELQGTMHRAEDVEAMTTDLVSAVRGALVALPGRVASDVLLAKTKSEAVEVIRQEVNQVMQSLAGYQYDPLKYRKKVRERQKWTEQNEHDDDNDTT